ncbi:MAG: succinate dehydrogenase cytochrome b subunit [Bdellovibrionales bacterium]|nr:succinate dehydrogenase cytochrome b subunit [Bdellovibrionales bacterium]
MNVSCEFYRSSVGKKVVVALTGAVLFLFVVGHMLGNLKTFMGMDASGIHHLDMYAHFLRSFAEEAMGHGNFLWLTRFVLLGCLLVHIVTVAQLQARSSEARPVKYKKQSLRASSVAARTMWYGGILVFLFIVLHLGHLTLGTLHSDFIEGRVYRNVYIAFHNPIAVIGYLVAMCVLGFHLYHGVWSFFQTLGLETPDRNCALTLVGTVGSFGIRL